MNSWLSVSVKIVSFFPARFDELDAAESTPSESVVAPQSNLNELGSAHERGGVWNRPFLTTND